MRIRGLYIYNVRMFNTVSFPKRKSNHAQNVLVTRAYLTDSVKLCQIQVFYGFPAHDDMSQIAFLLIVSFREHYKMINFN